MFIIFKTKLQGEDILVSIRKLSIKSCIILWLLLKILSAISGSNFLLHIERAGRKSKRFKSGHRQIGGRCTAYAKLAGWCDSTRGIRNPGSRLKSKQLWPFIILVRASQRGKRAVIRGSLRKKVMRGNIYLIVRRVLLLEGRRGVLKLIPNKN